MKISDFDYELPEEKIAQVPIEPVIMLNRWWFTTRRAGTSRFALGDLIDYLYAHDLIFGLWL